MRGSSGSPELPRTPVCARGCSGPECLKGTLCPPMEDLTIVNRGSDGGSSQQCSVAHRYARGMRPGSPTGSGLTADRRDVNVSRIGPGRCHIAPVAGRREQGPSATPEAEVTPGTPDASHRTAAGRPPDGHRTATGEIPGRYDMASARRYPGAHRVPAGVTPVADGTRESRIMGTGPVPATRNVLDRTGAQGVSSRSSNGPGRTALARRLRASSPGGAGDPGKNAVFAKRYA